MDLKPSTERKVAAEASSFSSPSHSSLSLSPSWFVTKVALLQSLGFIYFIAFLSAHYQNDGLMGEYGLVPARDYWDQIVHQPQFIDASWWQKFRHYPSIFWFISLNDDTMRMLNLSGLTLSILVMLGQGGSMLILFILWILYFSIVTSAGGTSFYSYGWESQLLETGFLAMFLCNDLVLPPNLLHSRQSLHINQSPIILWLFRWLSFRISMGAGLIKIRGDSCWTQRTCLLYHFETQPIPSPTSFFFHFLPPFVLQRAVDLDLLVQVYTSWMVLMPTYISQWPRLSKICLSLVRLGGVIQASFMLNIILSGNLGFLPHLTIVPALACWDDDCWPQWMRKGYFLTEMNVPIGPKLSINDWSWRRPRPMLNVAYAILVLYMSHPVVVNFLQLDGSRQQMNASFDSFRLVNTYGAFGSVGKKRYEPIVSITYDSISDNSNNSIMTQDSLEWIELEFPCKPGSIHRRPCFCEPYHCKSRLWKGAML
jgi:lipase maturation factor 1